MQTKQILATVERDRRLAGISKRRAGELLGCRSPEKNAQIAFYNSFLGGTAVTLEKLRRFGKALHRDALHYLATYATRASTVAPVAAETRAIYSTSEIDRLSPDAATKALAKLATIDPTVLGDTPIDSYSPAAARAILRAWQHR